MLREIDLSELHCFADDQKLDGLTPNSFVFAPNGSGKTSITRLLTSPKSALKWDHSAPISLRVFNSDFQRKAFADSELEGVFLLGTDSIRLEEQLIEARDERNRQNDSLNKKRDALTQKKSELIERKNQLGNTLKDIRKSIPKTITEEWTGSKRVKSLIDNSLKKFNGTSITPDWNSLENQAALLFDEAAEEFNIPHHPNFYLPLFENLPVLLAKPLIPAKELPLSELISDFKLFDWVAEGQEHRTEMRKHEEDRCPFCQQELPIGFDKELALLFDHEYEKGKDRIESCRTELEQFSNSIINFLDANDHQFRQVDTGGIYLQQRAEFERHLAEVRAKVAQKMQEPSRKIVITGLEETVSRFSELLEEFYKEMSQRNEVLKRKARERKIWLDQVWNAFANGSAFDTLSDYKKSTDQLEKAVSGLEKQVTQAEKFVKDAETKLRTLEAKTVSSESTITNINSMLQKCQFHSFRLAKSKHKKDGYTVVRNDGTAIDPLTLSEGERTFITFLYYYQSLSSVRGKDETEDLIAIIDDPISSLDYSIMFVVSSLIRALLQEIRDKTHPRVKQAIILTHNPRFHNEVAYGLNQARKQSVSFFRIKKLAPSPNEIQRFGTTNPVRTSYQELWKAVADLGDGKNTDTPGWLPNTLRRILESYFITLGGAPDLYSLGDVLSSGEQSVHNALIAWTHHGSHEVIESDDFAITSEPCEVWLKAFKRIFIDSGNGAHYEMMLKSFSSDSR
ncbi:AAA family ATPase [Corynebacterium sp. HMSC068H04]|uniref:AAA family ATPase n=1 Tax=Corynebacterium sp. HMSC068H04 TaxID=1739296 RepID=UPI0013014852|nr:AAA family ATPase [Corynebacterium sp. HMSC068H04]